MNNFIKLLIAIIIPQFVGLTSGLFTIASIPTWYAGLTKPTFAPPNWLFAPAWTTLYFLMGLASYLVWQKGWRKKQVKIALYLYGGQLILNFFWSILFFGLKSPLLALIGIIILWVMILLTLIKFYRVIKLAGYLLIPYLLWVSFASVINFSILVLN